MYLSTLPTSSYRMGQIDDRESRLLDSFIKEVQAKEDTYKQVQAVYAEHEERRSLSEPIASIGTIMIIRQEKKFFAWA